MAKYYIYLNDSVYKSTDEHREVPKIKREIKREFPMGKITVVSSKDIWLSIQSNMMMRDTMRELIQDIKEHNIEYTSYGAQRRIYLHLENVPQSFRDELNNWVHYQPVTQLSKPPNVSDYDIVDW